MTLCGFAVVDRPIDLRKPRNAWDELLRAVAQLANDKAVKVPSHAAGREQAFRASVKLAAFRAGIVVSIHKTEGGYLVTRRTDVVA